MGDEKPVEILKSAILLEKRGRAFYRKIAGQTDHPAVRRLFEMMAEEEEKHVQVLARQFREYRETGGFLPVEEGHGSLEVAGEVLSQDLKREISAAGYEAAAIAAAMSMEERAIDLYAGRAKEATDPAERALYTWLADWERGHLAFLSDVDGELRQEVWHDNKFWPF